MAVLRQAWDDAEAGDAEAQAWLCGGDADDDLRFWCAYIFTERDRRTARSSVHFGGMRTMRPGEGGETLPLDPACIGERARARWGAVRGGGVQ